MAGERGVSLFVRATRAKVAPMMLGPVAVGSALAWERTGIWSWARVLLAVVGAAAMHLGANVLNDVYDEESGAEVRARADAKSLATGSGVLGAGLMSKRALLSLTATLFAVGAACGVALALMGRPHVLWMGAAGALIAWQYTGPPLRLSYLGRGTGEVAIFLAFGVLPVAGSYYIQAGVLDAAALWASLVPGLLTTLVLYHHHFLHWQSDRAVGKMTPVAALKPQLGLAVGRIALIVTALVLAAQTLVWGLFPPAAFLAVLTLVPVGIAQQGAAEEPDLEAFVRLLGATLGAAALTAIAIVVAEVVRVVIR